MAVKKMNSASKAALKKTAAKRAKVEIPAAEEKKRVAFIKKHKLTHFNLANYGVGKYVKGKSKATWSIHFDTKTKKYVFKELGKGKTGAKVDPKIVEARKNVKSLATAAKAFAEKARGAIAGLKTKATAQLEKITTTAKAKLAKAKDVKVKAGIRKEALAAKKAVRATFAKAKLAHRVAVWEKRVEVWKARAALAKSLKKEFTTAKPAKPTLVRKTASAKTEPVAEPKRQPRQPKQQPQQPQQRRRRG